MILKLLDAGTYNVLRLAAGSTSHRHLPLPKQWDPTDPPHVALIEYTGDRVFCFLISQYSDDSGEIWVKNLESVQDDTVVEVKYNSADYKYYRRTGEYWAKVAEKKDQFFVDVYQRGTFPLTVPTLDDNWSALD